jgi:hypothetical protein
MEKIEMLEKIGKLPFDVVNLTELQEAFGVSSNEMKELSKVLTQEQIIFPIQKDWFLRAVEGKFGIRMAISEREAMKLYLKRQQIKFLEKGALVYNECGLTEQVGTTVTLLTSVIDRQEFTFLRVQFVFEKVDESFLDSTNCTMTPERLLIEAVKDMQMLRDGRATYLNTMKKLLNSSDKEELKRLIDTEKSNSTKETIQSEFIRIEKSPLNAFQYT